MATVSTSTNLNGVTYASGEDISITSGAVLTIDAQVPADVTALSTLPGIISCVTSGKLRIVNTSTSTPLVVSVLNNNDDFRFEKNGIFETRGNYIEVGTGNGSTQTFDISAFPSNYWPSVVQVETASGSNEYLPWCVIPTAGTTVTHATTEFGALKDGQVIFYNHSTRVLSCGDNTNGVSIPSGAKVRVANICITSGSNSATPTLRTLLDMSPTGTLDCEWTSFSNAIWFSMSGHGAVRLVNCGFTGGWACSSTNSNVEYDGFQLNPDTEQTATATTFSNIACLGEFRMKRVSVFTGGLVTGGAKFVLNQLFGIVGDIDDVWACRKIGATSANDELLVLAALFKKDGSRLTLRNWIIIGRVKPSNLVNVDMVDIYHAGAHGTTLSTLQTSVAFQFANCQGIKIVGVQSASLSPNYNQQFINADINCVDIAVYNMNVNANNGTLGFISANSGTGVRFFNSVMTNVRSGGVLLDAPATYLQSENGLFNCKATMFSGSQTTDGGKNAQHNLSPSAPTVLNTSMAGADSYAFANLVDLGAAPTTGSIVCGPFGAYTGLTLSGTSQLDQAGGIEMPTSGDIVEVESLFSMRGVTSFQNAVPTFTYTEDLAGVGTLFTDTTTAPAGVTFEFRVRNPSGTYGSYASLTGANLSGALAALSGYDSDLGFYMQIRITTTTTDVFRILNQLYVLTNIDNTFTWPDATITLQGPNLTDVTHIVRASDNTSLYSFTGAGTFEFTVGANFGVECYLRREDSGAVVLMRTLPKTIVLTTGDNGNCPLFYGEEIQLAQASDVSAIKTAVDAYLDVAISSRLATAGYTAPDNASITSILTDTDELQTNQGDWLTATGFATPTNVSDAQTAIITQIDANETKIDAIDTVVDGIASSVAALNDFDPAVDQVIVATNNDKTGYSLANNAITSSVVATNAFSNSAFTTGYFNSINAEVDTALADYDGPTKAELDSAEADIIAALPASAPSASTVASAVRTELTTELGRIDVATSTRLATSGYTAPANADIAAILVDTGTTIPAQISGLNNISAADVNAQVDIALADYDGPTKAELDAAQLAIETIISGLNDLSAASVSEAVWDYLQSETTVSDSMKEAIEISLRNSKLIPATV